MTTPLRAGIIGTGFMGRVHAHAIRANGHVVAALAGSTPERAAAAQAAIGSERVVADLAELVESVDVVHVCTPNALHTEQARLAIERGLPVICEKPLAVDAGAATELTRFAEHAGVVTAVPFVYRFYPLVREARARVTSGSAGAVRLVHGSYLQDWLAGEQDWNWRVDAAVGGPSRAFADIGVHWCDLAEFVTGQRIVRLAARTVTTDRRRDGALVRPDTEDAVLLQFETDGGALGSAVISQLSHGRKNRLWLSVDGSHASLAFDQELPDTLWVGGAAQTTVVSRGGADTGPAARRYDALPTGHPQGYQDCFTAFVADAYRAIRGEEVDGLPRFADGARAAILTAAVLDAAKTGAWTDVAPPEDTP